MSEELKIEYLAPKVGPAVKFVPETMGARCEFPPEWGEADVRTLVHDLIEFRERRCYDDITYDFDKMVWVWRQTKTLMVKSLDAP